jgi:hypothetical protein
MRSIVAAVAIALLAIAGTLPASAETGLAVICANVSAEGATVGSMTCPNSAQRYDHPQATSLVRVDPQATLGGYANWSRTSFVWKRWDRLVTGELYEVCTTNIPPGTPTEPRGVCVGWTFVAKAGTPVPPPVQQRVEVTFVPATQNTDCSPIPAWDSGLPGRLLSTHVQWGTVGGDVFTPAGEVRAPMPETTTAFDALVSDAFRARAQHMLHDGGLSDWSPLARMGETVNPPPCVPPPPPVDCVVSDWQLGTPTPATCPVSGLQSRVDSRTILTQPANGGAACPTLTRTESVACTYVPPPPTNPCALRPFSFSVRTWPGGITGSRSLAYSSNKAVDRFELGRSGSRVTRVTATDLEGCTSTVMR